MLSFLLLATACSQQNVRQDAKIKNIILMIGDGMGPQQLGLLREYAQRAQSSIYLNMNGTTAFDKFAKEGYIGLASTSPADALVVDSACSASQLASGISSGSEMIGLDQNGYRVETILEKAKKMGKSTGLVSDTRITHATPAAFAAHQPHRSLENEIALQMLSSNNVDVMLSGGLRHWLPETVNSEQATRQYYQKLINEENISISSKRKDKQDLLQQAQRQGYELAFNREQMQSVKNNKLIGLFNTSAMADAIDYYHNRAGNQPSLAEMTDQALAILDNNPEGFFLMVQSV